MCNLLYYAKLRELSVRRGHPRTQCNDDPITLLSVPENTPIVIPAPTSIASSTATSSTTDAHIPDALPLSLPSTTITTTIIAIIITILIIIIIINFAMTATTITTLPTPATGENTPGVPSSTTTFPNDANLVKTCSHCDRTLRTRIGLVCQLRIRHTKTGEPIAGTST
ncbi:hypothetical protein SprV_0100223400 [Sparganum proliferum]